MKRFISFRALTIVCIALATTSILFIVQSQGEVATSNSSKKEDEVTVKVQVVEPVILRDTMVYSGILQPASDVQILSETQGQITRMPIEIGFGIARGSVIAEVEKSLKEAAVITAEATQRQMQRDATRLQALAAEGNATENEVELARLRMIEAEFNLKNYRRALEDAIVRAPFSGVVAEQFVRVGSTLAPGTPVIRLVDISSLRFVIAVQEHEIPTLKNGQSVLVTADVYPSNPLKANILAIAPTANQSGTFNVTFSLPNSTATPLKAGMTARTMLIRSSDKKIYAIPQNALTTVDGKEGVFLIRNGRAIPQRVQLGQSYGKFVEIQHGLTSGDSILIQGVNTIRTGNKVRIVTQDEQNKPQ